MSPCVRTELDLVQLWPPVDESWASLEVPPFDASSRGSKTNRKPRSFPRENVTPKRILRLDVFEDCSGRRPLHLFLWKPSWMVLRVA
jgi:hypothetical protein